MKRIFNLLLFISLFWLSFVYADNNKLYFTETNGRLYYDSALDDNSFMKHLDLVPGSVNEDTLVIENGTNTDYTLYLKLKPKSDAEEARELLSKLKMQIYLDNNLIYDGIASGVDYNNTGVNLSEAAKIGMVSAKHTYTLKVVTTLDTDYDNTENDEYSLVDWTFYAEYNDEVKEIIKVPITSKNSYTFIILSALIIVGVAIILLLHKRKQTSSQK